MPATTNYSLLGTHSVTVTVSMTNPFTGAAPLPITFDVNLKCTVTYTPPYIANIIYPTVGPFHITNLGVTVPPFLWSPVGCVDSYTWQVKTNLFPPLVPWITGDSSANLITIDTDGSLNAAGDCGYCADYVVSVYP